MYDVLNKYVLEGHLAPLNKGERDLALSHLEHCKVNDLILYDRGYPSYDFIYEHTKKGLDYLIRTKVSFSQVTMAFEQSKKNHKL